MKRVLTQSAMGALALSMIALGLPGCLETTSSTPEYIPGGEYSPGKTPDFAGIGPRNPITYHSVETGMATWFESDGTGNCSYEPDLKTPYVAAVSNFEYDNSFACGAFVRVAGPDGAVTAKIVDRCPSCAPGELDLSVQAFQKIASINDGTVPVTYEYVEGDTSGPMRYRLKIGSNQYWSAIQVLNHRHPLATVELLRGDGTWIQLERQTYNYWVYDHGWGNSPRDLRITDVFGQTVVDEAIVMKTGKDVPGGAQLPRLVGGQPPQDDTTDDATPVEDDEVEGDEGSEDPLDTGGKGATRDDSRGAGPVDEPTVTDGVDLRIVQETEWDTGYCSDVFLENVSEVPIEWQVLVPIEHALHYVWSADYELNETGDTLTLFGHPWNAVLEPGDEIDFGFCTEDNP